jgi:hypothetical protein
MFIKTVSIFMSLGISSCALAADVSFDFALPKPAVTSAGVYDDDGRLLRVLWTMEKLDAGKFSRAWDGKDDLGHDVPAGAYTYKIVANRGTYANVGAIGNSGVPADAHNHTPAHIAAIAVDEEGSVYSANGWDEAGADFKKWDKDGKSLFDANFSIRNGHPNGAPYAIAVDDKYIYCSVGGWANAPWNEAQQIQRFDRKDGKPAPFTKTGREDGHIQVYEWPSKLIPPGTSEADAEMMKLPLRSLATDDKAIFCADLLGNRILRFDKVTGEANGELKIEQLDRPPYVIPNSKCLLRCLTIDPKGNVLCGIMEKNPKFKIAFPQFFELNSTTLVPLHHGFGRPIAANGFSVAVYAPNKKLYFIDLDNLVHKNKDDGLQFVWDRPSLLGRPAKPGSRAAQDFFHLNSIAVDKDGNIFTAQDEPYGGARLAKFSPDETLLWEHFGCEFVSLGNYGVDHPDRFYSMTFHDYRLLDHAAGKWDYIGNGSPFPTRKFYADVHGVPRVLTLGDHSFYFLPSGDGVQIYRLDGIIGKVFHLAALVGGRSPAPDGSKESKDLGQWTWHDADGSGEPKPEQINWFKQPGQGHYSCFGMDVDAAGNIIFANTETHSIWIIPIGPLDPKGNPTYDWKEAKEAFPKDRSATKFEPNMVQRADDGSFYAFGWSATFPQPKDNPFWMGGTTLARFDKTGKLLWAVKLPKLAVGLDVIPGGKGGCFVGEGKDARLDHFSADGLLIGAMQPGEAMCKQTGWLDNHASVAVNRDRRDGILDVFAEDDYVLRIGWYRVDDRDMETHTGAIRLK